MQLDPVSVRVLGSLMEKEMTTPDLYPLSVNSLLAASNQKSSREPVMELTEDEVRQALHTLEDLQLVAAVRDGRVARYEHRIRTVLSLRRDETAVLCLLLLRGAQTTGELRGRADRLFAFDGLEAVQATLERLAARPEPLVTLLPRAAGAREARWAHLLAPHQQPAEPQPPSRTVPAPPSDDLELRVRLLEEKVARLEAALSREPHSG